MVELWRGVTAASPVVGGQARRSAHPTLLASCVGRVQLLLEVVKLLRVVGVRIGRPRPHNRRVFVVSPSAPTPTASARAAGVAAGATETAGRQGLGGVGAVLSASAAPTHR